MLYEKQKKKAYGFVTVVLLFFFYVQISNKTRTKIQSGLSNDSRGCFIFLEKFSDCFDWSKSILRHCDWSGSVSSYYNTGVLID